MPAAIGPLTARAVVTAVVLLGLGASLMPGPGGAAPSDPEPTPVLAIVPTTNAFPVPAPYESSFSDDWHACRDGCQRLHQGNDIFADEGTPIVAVERGLIASVDNVDDSNGGLSIWLVGDSGVAYWYAHNSANYVTVGQRVERGQLIGRIGRTGNARTTPAHTHFQVNRCGELSSSEPCTVNPFAFLSTWTLGQVGGGPDAVGGGPDAVGLYRRSRASTELRIEGGSALPAFTHGRAPEGTGLAVAGDWNGDGRDTVGLYRRRDATFVLRNDNGKTLPVIRFGTPGDAAVVPVAGDWDGDGRDTVGLYRRRDATFVLRGDHGKPLPAVTFGWPGATDVLPVAGDWNGDGRDSLGLYRTRDGIFRRRDEQGGNLPPVAFGEVGAPVLPVAGDWDGDGRDTVGVYVRDEARFRLSGPDPADPDFGATTLPTGERPAADLVAVVGDWNGLDVVTLEDLRAIFGPLEDEVAVKAQMPLLNDAMRRSDATTPARKAAFLATIHNESNFRADAIEQANPSEFRGRGFIQLTGDFNYRAAGDDLGVDLLTDPTLAADPTTSARVAAWYWTVARDINRAADRLDMAAVNIAVGYRPSVREDTQRCGDFVHGLKWFNGGRLPEGVNCARSLTSDLLAAASALPVDPGRSSIGPEPATDGTGPAGTAPSISPAPPTSRPTATGSAAPAATATSTPPTTRRPSATTPTTRPPSATTQTTLPSTTTTTTTTTSTSTTTTTTTTRPSTTTTASTSTTSATTTTTVPCDPAASTTTTSTSTPCPTTTPPSSTEPTNTAASTSSTGSPAALPGPYASGTVRRNLLPQRPPHPSRRVTGPAGSARWQEHEGVTTRPGSRERRRWPVRR